jgi:UDP-N-acetylglucosamine 3-dehydrogenase
MKVGIISFAHGHANSYASSLVGIKEIDFIGIADSDVTRGKKAASRFKTVHFERYEDLLAQKLDAVIITSENSFHKEHAIAAAKSGAAVLCEKPLAHTVEDAKEIIRVCEEQGVLLQTAFPVRFNTAIKRAKQRIDAGEIGEILAMKGTNRGKNPGDWFIEKELSGGGAVIDHTVHVVDIMRWITGSEVEDVYAEVDQLFTETEIDDAGCLTMTFDSGIFATLDCSWSRTEKFPTWGDVTIEFIGSNGTLMVDAFRQKLDVYHENGVEWLFWGDDMDDGLVRDFINNVRKRKAPSVTGIDGLRALEVAIAAYRSSEQKKPVKLEKL